MSEEKDNKLSEEEKIEKLEKEFQRKLEELRKRDPFIYKNF